MLQESSVPPWQRDSIPLIYIEDTLASVWQLAVAVQYQRKLVVGNIAQKPVEPDAPTQTRADTSLTDTSLS